MTGERADLLDTLAKHRYFLRYTARDLTDEQAAQRTTVSELCLGGLIKHVTLTEQEWILKGPSVMDPGPDQTLDNRAAGFRMLEGETLAALAPGTRWSARRLLLHVIAETAQHAGHADIIREALDGAKSMG